MTVTSEEPQNTPVPRRRWVQKPSRPLGSQGHAPRGATVPRERWPALRSYLPLSTGARCGRHCGAGSSQQRGFPGESGPRHGGSDRNAGGEALGVEGRPCVAGSCPAGEASQCWLLGASAGRAPGPASSGLCSVCAVPASDQLALRLACLCPLRQVHYCKGCCFMFPL